MVRVTRQEHLGRRVSTSLTESLDSSVYYVIECPYCCSSGGHPFCTLTVASRWCSLNDPTLMECSAYTRVKRNHFHVRCLLPGNATIELQLQSKFSRGETCNCRLCRESAITPTDTQASLNSHNLNELGKTVVKKQHESSMHGVNATWVGSNRAIGPHKLQEPRRLKPTTTTSQSETANASKRYEPRNLEVLTTRHGLVWGVYMTVVHLLDSTLWTR